MRCMCGPQHGHTYAFDSDYRIPGSGSNMGSRSIMGSIRFSRSVASSAYAPVSTLESEESTTVAGGSGGASGEVHGQDHERSPV